MRKICFCLLLLSTWLPACQSTHPRHHVRTRADERSHQRQRYLQQFVFRTR